MLCREVPASRRCGTSVCDVILPRVIVIKEWVQITVFAPRGATTTTIIVEEGISGSSQNSVTVFL